MHNFTLQLKGVKRWFISTNELIENPIRGCTPHYNNIDTKEQQHKINKLIQPNFNWSTSVPTINNKKKPNYEIVELSPGSCMYFTAGSYHRVECLEDSISINISLMCSNYADLYTDAIKQLLYKFNHWRAPLFIQSPEQARNHLNQMLGEIQKHISCLTADDLLPNSALQSHEKPLKITSNNYKNYKTKFVDKTCFRINPLALLMKFNWSTNNGGSEGCIPKKFKSSHKSHSDSETSNHTDTDNDNTEIVNVAEECTEYVLHINFAGENLDSLVRLPILVSKQFEFLLDKIIEFVNIRNTGETAQANATFLLKDLILFIDTSNKTNQTHPASNFENKKRKDLTAKDYKATNKSLQLIVAELCSQGYLHLSSS
jgi:hypothetical protein